MLWETTPLLNVWRRPLLLQRLFRANHDANLRTGLAYLAQHEVVEQVVEPVT
jgi:hypothetical protein